jgi:hypothetical protein
LAVEVSPSALQSARQMLQLSKLYLQLALVAAGSLREDVEDESSAINNTAFQLAL